MIHTFAESLEYSHSQADATWWPQVYAAAFPDMIGYHDLRHNGWHQKAGRDRAVILSNGRTIYVDEKVRKETYPDIALEFWSQYPSQGVMPYPPTERAVEGWACKPLDCDFLAYAFVPIKTCYLLPFYGIRAAVTRHGGTFRAKAMNQEDGYRWVIARNNGYITVSIAVPIRALQDYINDAMTITWTETA